MNESIDHVLSNRYLLQGKLTIGVQLPMRTTTGAARSILEEVAKMAWGKTDEEKAAQHNERQHAIAEHEEMKRLEAYAASPVGRADAALRQGAAFFQLQIEVSSLDGKSSFGTSHSTLQQQARPDLLGQIEAVGWKLENVGYVFIETGATSTNRMLSTGQGTVTRGVVQGIYLFRSTAQLNR